MILSERTIQQVREASIVSVVGHYLKLNRQGMGCCPFHNEKTPSFKVSDKKGIYKCFGCGVAGDAIAFIMAHDKLEFIEAVETIANLEGIPIEYEEIKDAVKWEQQKTMQQQLHQALQFSIEFYRKNLWHQLPEHPAVQYIRERHLTKKEVIEWQLGWAGHDWRLITPELIQQNLFTPAEKLGLVKQGKADAVNYDGYRSRITIPIYNHQGRQVGLAGRYLKVDESDAGKNFPKYINPPESEIYSKSKVLFGLDKAIKSIQQHGFAFLVEGYFDVISMHKIGDSNTVGTCGTALTIEQARLLKRFTSKVIILRDGDDAGMAAAKKDLKILVKEGFKTEIAILPKNEDPDSYVAQLDSYNHPRPALNGVHFYDAIHWHVDELYKGAADEYQTGLIKQDALELLASIPNQLIRNNYFNGITKKYKWKASEMMKQLNQLAEDKEEIKLDPDADDNYDAVPEWMDKDELAKTGYCAVKNGKRFGYYSYMNGVKIEITNFIITPLFHVRGKESRHLIQIDNGKRKAVLDIESKALVSIDLLQQYIVSEGAFLIYGAKAQMLRIAASLLSNFPTCYEVHFLGWQKEGFFAFVDKIYVPGEGLKDLDQWGIMQHKDENYLVPAASAAYKELQRAGDDPYENERYLSYLPAPVTFSTWASQMQRVYQDKGITAVAYCILTIFRDIIFEIDNNCPHLYGFGERSSGKSKWADSIAALFYKKQRSAMNLNSGTDFAFFSYMQKFKNCPAQLNEFDEKVIKQEWFQAIKGVFDGEGRQRGVMGSKNKTEIMKIESTLVLTGQFLVTMDDNSIVSRSLIEGFHERELNEDDKQEYNKLKSWEDAGLTSLLVELLQHRADFKKEYKGHFDTTLSEWRRSVKGEFNQRIMQNWCHLATCYSLVHKKINLPVPAHEFETYCKKKANEWSRFIRNSDTLSEFWNTLAFLVDQGTLVDGWDYQIQEKAECTIRKDRNEDYTHQFIEPTKLLFLRLNNVHKHYQQAYRMRTGKEGMSLENLMHYFSSRKYFLGNQKQKKFKKWDLVTENRVYPQGQGGAAILPETKKVQVETSTSCHVFYYDQLGMDIERNLVENE
jgi:DNA primase